MHQNGSDHRQVLAIVLQLGNIDLTSPAGKMMLTMLSAVADLIVERTKAGQAHAEGKTKGSSRGIPER